MQRIDYIFLSHTRPHPHTQSASIITMQRIDYIFLSQTRPHPHTQSASIITMQRIDYTFLSHTPGPRTQSVTLLLRIVSYTAIQCSSLAAIDNATISYNPVGTEPFPFNTEATHTCDTFYTLTSGDALRVCGGDCSNTTEVWSGTAPGCSRNYCINDQFLNEYAWYTYSGLLSYGPNFRH